MAIEVVISHLRRTVYSFRKVNIIDILHAVPTLILMIMAMAVVLNSITESNPLQDIPTIFLTITLNTSDRT